ncbi:YheC/YheD family protein [Cohnella nanjingensis]|uniref:YheC/YheD family protein n=1 Tax=Cohnella nanjingensis TaxID=1387779 RepID=A0A7X0VEF1_9BACL|nr:YheC/YheD family protein [Cohnella nanjingensis]MBB6669474.1 YheC/YheD family protein [Cohnella nanjingensis]
MNYRSRTILSKWTKTRWLMTQGDLRRHIPHTRLFRRNDLTSMLSRHSTVYFKPTNGSGGVNIIRIKKKSQGYQTQLKAVKSSYASMDALYRKLNRFANGRSYVLQKGIQLARTNGNPFDIRVMVQKTKEGKWISTAVFTKIGRPGKVATNYNQGGRIGFFGPTMAGAGYNDAATKRIEAELKRMGVEVGRIFDRHQKGFRELGLDVAIDVSGKLWILEVNTRPQIYPLKNMKDQTLYRRILAYARPYGRTR